MTRDRWPGDRESPGDLAGRQLARLELLQDLPPGGVRERLENGAASYKSMISYFAKLVKSPDPMERRENVGVGTRRRRRSRVL